MKAIFDIYPLGAFASVGSAFPSVIFPLSESLSWIFLLTWVYW